ncbi:hypothetical protein RirG_028280 [Rhizophagus irregularis DAOM 197198w]|uniref:DUF8211 domain-containing protein n=3 Tax=Rhizophagus irregularis TaxID=588596 RepID=A0A015KBJ9_RHIIW|nr:hypothetical protein RirG_028280 [Rhizophagus irregularis DAOM 197198w]
MLTHFFSSQRVIPRRIQQKYFNFIRDKLLARKDIIRSRANSHTSRNIHTRTFFNFTYKKYRFYLGLYIPCHHLSPTPGIGPRPSSCAVPAPFVMSKCRRACVMHQHTFFKSNLYHNIRIDNNDTRIINASGVVNSKQSHGNLLHQRWNNRVKKKIYSNRLGISYDSSYHARNVSSVLKHNNTHMYRKRLDNFSPKYSDNDKTKKRQETRFARLCKRIFNKPEHNRRNTTRHQLNTARRYRFLFLPSQYINKPIKHLIYTHGLDYPNYGFVTPYRIDREDKEKKLISSMTFTNPHSQEVYHTVAPYRPFPDMFIPHKYRNIIPKDPIYDNTGNFIIPGSREWFTYMHNLHQSGTIPIPILTGQVTQYEYYAEQAAEHDRIAKIERDKEESSIHIKKNFGTTYLRHIDRTREINRLFNKSEEFDFKMKHFTSDLRQFGSDRDHRAYIDHELKEFNERYKADTYGKRYVLESELSDNTKELERRPNKRNPTMVPNNFFTSQENRYKRRLNPPAEADDSPGAGPSMFNNLRSLHAKYLF